MDPLFATISVQPNAIYSLIHRYIDLELLNYARIFLAYFLKFDSLNKWRCKRLSLGAIANYCGLICPLRAHAQCPAYPHAAAPVRICE